MDGYDEDFEELEEEAGSAANMTHAKPNAAISIVHSAIASVSLIAVSPHAHRATALCEPL